MAKMSSRFIKISGKRADEKILSFYMFIVWIIIALAIVGGVYIFYSARLDIRNIQSESLANNLIGCLTEDGFIKTKVLEENFDVFSECNLNKNIIEDKREFFLKVSFKDVDSGQEIRELIIAGEKDFEIQCGLRENAEVRDEYAVCASKEIYILYKTINPQSNKLENKKAIIDIFTGSNVLGGVF
ncbi:hypothetical protein J4466_02355 [Candidatus Pacearchaeota archaeon]|nr:hypothetical protein [Candidatus Pacearchaeota archaeon]